MILLRNDHERKICNGDVFEVRAIEHDDDDDEVIWITGLFDDGRELMFPAKIEDVQHGADMAGEAAPVAFAYAITAHKSQGSEWRDVLVVDESKVFGLDAKRWLYTAATRAREHLAIVRRI
jgi:exodeoxyribonuclease-5